MLARIRKAVVAGLGAGITTGVGALVVAGNMSRENVSQAIGVGITAAATVGWATWRAPNAKQPLASGGIIRQTRP
ncbi:hypothetical protein OWR29_25620 [Actinoplanes sp. Pm04-4]|uniref:Uncharacterized protein n=1 Tax=Paractinoplanes pyxinae TaxID=2997416 RepID=A0ABT4B4H4_9ACTN|nr:hypothetical protein [Actinoplanes pyxinae]MCY1141392.1 hypothetical protein [Actinoplanes pyxinae]